MKIENHPMLGIPQPNKDVVIYYEGREIHAREGQTVAAALLAEGIYQLGHSRNLSQPRGMYCANGRCHSCLMTIDGVERVRACFTLVRNGMTITRSMDGLSMGGDTDGN